MSPEQNDIPQVFRKQSNWRLGATFALIALACLLVGLFVGGSYMAWRLNQANWGTYGFALLVYPAGGAVGGLISGLVAGGIWVVFKKKAES